VRLAKKAENRKQKEMMFIISQKTVYFLIFLFLVKYLNNKKILRSGNFLNSIQIFASYFRKNECFYNVVGNTDTTKI